MSSPAIEQIVAREQHRDVVLALVVREILDAGDRELEEIVERRNVAWLRPPPMFGCTI